ncbi:PTS sugar transporter subunit IIA [Halanaerobacter jeridensis]|uniref:Ascorbate-specific PTS system EIIA component n=1 Tax=Halanaerobacter jeridensis TaxID=706427 RepID=A0A939BQB1_9FIRM|nr:PTS sugar transporter subunit IIA [Halanaerobacter jeridensis]MBM7556104.1 PTS system ascorbate-specific IIA component [Halanaerobacter jeridensis]
MLLEILAPTRIITGVEVENWQEVTKKAGELLLKDELIEEEYITAMINSIKENGPYVVLAQGIAILHARPEDGVKELGMSLITLDPPIEFGHQSNDPVEVALAFGAVDEEKHVEAMSELTTLLMSDNVVEKMHAKEDADKLYQYITEVLNSKEKGE